VAFQFAIITGATDELYAPYQKPGGSQILSPNPQPHTFGKHGSVTDIPNPTNEDWFENEAANGPWDFFDMDSQRNPAM
jgi:hypothetical protein